MGIVEEIELFVARGMLLKIERRAMLLQYCKTARIFCITHVMLLQLCRMVAQHCHQIVSTSQRCSTFACRLRSGVTVLLIDPNGIRKNV